MKLRVLGCSGGIGGSLRTTSFLLNENILMDAGTGVGDLSLDELKKIDHIFLTHSHLDHILSIPLLIDSIGATRDKPVIIHALPETIDSLKKYIFNWHIWPDFTTIPSKDNAFLGYNTFTLGDKIEIGNGETITPIPVSHVVPAVGFWLNSGKESLVFSGDTISCEPFWNAINQIDNLKYLLIETAFSNEDSPLASASKHFYPEMLINDLEKLVKTDVEIFVTHFKPMGKELIYKQILDSQHRYNPTELLQQYVFEF